jgi:hypothetical protein
VGRRAIRTGDLIVSRHQSTQLWRQADGNLDSSDCVVQDCTMGIVIGLQQVTYVADKFNKKNHTKTMVMVYDSTAMKYGWTNVNEIKRVE